MTVSLQRKNVVITGGTKGIGLAIAKCLAMAGANIVITSRHQSECNDVAESLSKIGGKAIGIQADITKEEERKKLFSSLSSTVGSLDILINNAGCAITKKAELITESEWDTVMNLNLKAAFFCAQEAGKLMIPKRRGKIINISSILGIKVEKQVLPYCVSKSGLLQMTKALALEWAKYNIQVNAICPGYIKTELNQDIIEKSHESFIQKIPQRRLATGNDIGTGVIYLCSDDADYITGQQIVIDGGWLLN